MLYLYIYNFISIFYR